MAEPVGRFTIAFDDATLHHAVDDWTRIDNYAGYPNIVASYTIDRGRQYELDRTDVGRATVVVNDPIGVLDPTNVAGPFYGKVMPLKQAAISRWDPVADAWFTRFRGFIEELDYVYNPEANVNQLTVSLVDVMEIIRSIEMTPAEFGSPGTPPERVGQIWYENQNMDDRILAVLGDAGIPNPYYVVFSGNVILYEGVYSPGQSAMDPVLEAVDAEWPGIGNGFCDRFGRFCAHGRLSKFDPAGVAAGVDPTIWDWRHWRAGDGAFVHADPAHVAHIRRFAFNRGLSKIINRGYATPLESEFTGAELAAQLVEDTVSINDYFGVRSWSAQNLLTKQSLLDGADALTETKRFAQFYVDNFAQPRDRITDIAFRSMQPGTEGAGYLWNFLSHVDISDRVDVSIESRGAPDSGGFIDEPYYVEGIHEENNPLHTDYDDVTVTLDLSPASYFASNPWGDT